MRVFILIFFWGLAAGLPARGQTSDSLWLRRHYVKQEVYIPMRDGVRLYTAIYTPVDTVHRHPILLMRTPYSCAPYGPEEWWPALWLSYFKQHIRKNYCMVIQDVRGAYMSEGKFVDIRPFIPDKKASSDVDEASDTYDTIDWLIKNNKGNNGRVGVQGISYPGFYAAMAALCGHPALKAVSPQAPVTDWFMGDDLHHNGAFFLQDAFSFYVQMGFGDPRPLPTQTPWRELPQPDPDSYRYFLGIGAIPNFTRLAGDSIAFWKDLMAHPDLDSFWRARNDRAFVGHILPTTATLVVGGLFDAEDLYGAWHLYRAIEGAGNDAGSSGSRNENKIVMGPWYHGQWSSSSSGSELGRISFGSNTADWYKEHVELPFFDAHLLSSSSTDRLPEATIFFTGENRWRQFSRWPPASARHVEFFLGAGHGLTPAVSAGADSYVSDPANPVPYTWPVPEDRNREYMDADQRFAAARRDVLVYETPPLDRPMRFAGPVTADLWVSLSTTDADFVVKLIDVFPASADTTISDYQMLVRGDVMRGRYRTGFSQPEPFVPGRPTEVRFGLNDIAHTFKRGHRIMVQIQSSWFPLVSRNPQQFVDIYHAGDKDYIPATVTVYHDATFPSGIILNMLQ